MIEIKCIKTGLLDVNTYIVNAYGRNDCIIIDPGDEFEKINETKVRLGLDVKALFITHCHFDHIGAVAPFCKKGVAVYMAEVSERALRYTVLHGKVMGSAVRSFSTDFVLLNGAEYEVAGIKIKALHTPGHSPTSFCFLIENTLFTGDTLFSGSYGRCDFQDGDLSQLKRSIEDKLFALDGDYSVYPGHGEFTMLDRERVSNPILFV